MFALSLFIAWACIANVDAKLKLPTFKFNVRTAVASVIAATSFQSPLMSHSFQVPSAQAAVNPLADVGLKEFLVKDGRQFLRLAVPVGKCDVSDYINDE